MQKQVRIFSAIIINSISSFKYLSGLGGLLTGNAAHGGLSASAGTPFGKLIQHDFKTQLYFFKYFSGQRAAAGLGGTVDEAG